MTIENPADLPIGKTCAWAVRLGLLSQTRALAFLATKQDYAHRRAVEALLPVLDSDGMTLLLGGANVLPDRSWPVEPVATRLAAFERWDEALGLVLGAEDYRIYRLVELFPALRGAPQSVRDALLEAARADLEAETASDEPDLDVFVEAAPLFEAGERLRVLEAGLAAIDRVGDESLFWDSGYGQRDPRLLLAEAFVAQGMHARARSLLERVRELPHPFASGPTTPDLDLLQTWLRCGDVPNDLFQSLSPYWRMRARLELPVDALTRLGTTRPDPSELPTGPDDFAILRLALDTGAPELGRRAVLSLMALVERALVAPEEPRNAATLGRGTLEGVAEGARYLHEGELTRAIEFTWRMLQERTKGPTTWQVLSALCQLLQEAKGLERTQRVSALLAFAMQRPDLKPPLPELTGWELLFSETEQRAYLTSLLRHWGLLAS